MRKEPELIKEEQFKRFAETARKHRVDESGKALERAFEKLGLSGQPNRCLLQLAAPVGQEARAVPRFATLV